MDRSAGRLRNLAFTSLAHFTNDGTVFFVPVIAAILADRFGRKPQDRLGDEEVLDEVEVGRQRARPPASTS